MVRLRSDKVDDDETIKCVYIQEQQEAISFIRRLLSVDDDTAIIIVSSCHSLINKEWI